MPTFLPPRVVHLLPEKTGGIRSGATDFLHAGKGPCHPPTRVPVLPRSPQAADSSTALGSPPRQGSHHRHSSTKAFKRIQHHDLVCHLKPGSLLWHRPPCKQNSAWSELEVRWQWGGKEHRILWAAPDTTAAARLEEPAGWHHRTAILQPPPSGPVPAASRDARPYVHSPQIPMSSAKGPAPKRALLVKEEKRNPPDHSPLSQAPVAQPNSCCWQGLLCSGVR